MARRVIALLILILTILTLQPVQAQSGRQVWAFYMGFWLGGGSWDAQSDVLIDHPSIGNYDSRDGGVVGTQIDQAKGAGIDAFIVSWYGVQEGGTTAVLNNVLDRASERGFHAAAAVDVYDSDFNRNRAAMVDSLNYLITDRANHPGYLRYDGKPVIFFAFQSRTGFSAADWQGIRNEVDPGHSTLWIAEGLQGCCIYGGAMDGMYAFNLAWADGSSGRYSSEASATYSAGGSLYIPTIHPGWDEDAIAAREGRPNPTSARDRAGGQFLANSFAGAAASGANVILVVSWNEFIENSHIEPSTTYGTQSLDTLRTAASSWKAGGGVTVPTGPSTSNPTAPVTSTQPVQGQPPAQLGEQINPGGASINVFCAQGGIAVYNGGDFAMFVTGTQIATGLQAARDSGQNQQIGTGPLDTGLWALTSNELQATVRGARPEYNFIFAADRCGSLDAPVVSQPQPVTGAASAPVTGSGGIYTVVSGDTMYGIAARFGVTVNAIAEANGLSDPGLIYVGQQLVIPGTTTGATTAPVVSAPAPSTGTTSTTPTTGGTTTGGTCTSPYTVVSGDTLSSIAYKCGTTVSALVSANDITNSNLIALGQQLTIP